MEVDSEAPRSIRSAPLLSEQPRPWRDPGLADRPEERNSAQMASIQLVNTMIGSGILTFPYVFSSTGWVLGVFFLGVFAALNVVSNMMMIETGASVGMEAGDTTEIVEKALGSVLFRRIVEVCVAIEAFGALLSYINVMGDLGASVLFKDVPGAYPAVIAACSVLLSPVCFYRAYGDIAWVSFFSFLLITITVVCISMIGITAAHAVPASPKSLSAFLATLGNFAFSTANQYAVHEAYSSMRGSERPSIGRVIEASASGGSSLLLSLGIGGVAAVGARSNRVTSNVVKALNPDLALTKFLAVVTILHMLLYIPNDFIIMRLYGCRFFDVNPLTIPRARYNALTFFLLLIPATLMASIPRADVVGVFQLVVSLTGSLPIALGVYFVPIYAFKVACLDTKSRDDAPPSLFPFLRKHPWLTYACLSLSLLTFTVVPSLTIWFYVYDCQHTSCSAFGHR